LGSPYKFRGLKFQYSKEKYWLKPKMMLVVTFGVINAEKAIVLSQITVLQDDYHGK
jgi:hypothetical protein